jgi:hypothetical protein
MLGVRNEQSDLDFSTSLNPLLISGQNFTFLWRPLSTFFIFRERTVQLQGLEAHDLSHTHPLKALSHF